MDLGLTGRTALITGGSQGIGAATANVMAAEGVNLVLVARNLAKLEQTREAILASHPVTVEIGAHDLSNSEEIAKLADRHPDIDILVNNAGAVPGGSLFEVSEAQWRKGWDTKVFAYINMCRTYYPIIKARGGGVIVNVLGTGSLKKDPGYCCGGMGNAALDFFTQTLGGSSHKDNMRVVGIAPGPTSTERLRGILEADGVDPSDTARRPFGRVAMPEEIGAAIAFAASQRSAYTSGTIIVVDGGASVSKVPERPQGSHRVPHGSGKKTR